MKTKRLYISESERLYETIGRQQCRIKELEAEVLNLINRIKKQSSEICNLEARLIEIRELTNR